jgi:hypothetical protein
MIIRRVGLNVGDELYQETVSGIDPKTTVSHTEEGRAIREFYVPLVDYGATEEANPCSVEEMTRIENSTQRIQDRQLNSSDFNG